MFSASHNPAEYNGLKFFNNFGEKVVDEFNGFLFQHTSRISLDDILAAQKKKQDERKVKSPYTKEYKETNNSTDGGGASGSFSELFMQCFQKVRGYDPYTLR